MVFFVSCGWSDWNGLSFSEGKIQKQLMRVSTREDYCIFVGGWGGDWGIFFQKSPNIYHQLVVQNTINLREETLCLFPLLLKRWLMENLFH